MWRRLYGRNAKGAAEVEQIAVLQQAAAQRRAEYAQEEQAALTERVHAHVAARLGPVDPGVLANLEWATPSFLAAAGLTRLLTKRGEAPAVRT